MGEASLSGALRAIPSVDRLLADPSFSALRGKYSEDLVKIMLRRSLEELRQDIRHGKAGEADCSFHAVVARTSKMCESRLAPKFREVINATGVIVHTNLGRSPLSKRVAERITRAAIGYSNLEYDLEKGHRGERNTHLMSLMEELTGAEAALAVNNNAAAVLLASST